MSKDEYKYASECGLVLGLGLGSRLELGFGLDLKIVKVNVEM